MRKIERPAIPSGLAFKIYGLLRSAIANQSIASGSVLLEAVIADGLTTSRTPVRAALEALSRDKLVHKLEGRGYLVLGRNGATPRRRLRIGRQRIAELAQGDFGGRSPAWLRVLDEIEAEVATAAVHGPLRVVESEIGKLFNVSRTVVREALSRLQRSGVIEKDERLHWQVVSLTTERTRHLYELRRALEPAALRRAAENGLFEDAAGMRDRLILLRERLSDVTARELQPFERELHVDALGLCGNPEIMQALWVAQIQISANHKLFERMTDLFPMIVTEHLGIADRLANRDLAGAVEALESHLDPNKADLIASALERLAASASDALPPYLHRDGGRR